MLLTDTPDKIADRETVYPGVKKYRLLSDGSCKLHENHPFFMRLLTIINPGNRYRSSIVWFNHNIPKIYMVVPCHISILLMKIA